jgi:simple sugar transport system permease protein
MKHRVLWMIAAAVAAVAGSFLLAGRNPAEATAQMIQGSLGSPGAFGGTMREVTPLLFAGLAVFIALRAGLFNIGVEGQLIVGALACSAIALRVSGPGGAVLGVFAGMLAGCMWALPAGWIKAYRNGHEVITTIMLNNIALLLTGYLVAGPFRSPTSGSPTTATLPAESRLPNLVVQPFPLNWSLVLGVAGVVLLFLWLRRTVGGYELEAVGANPRAATFAGIGAKRTIVSAMAASGAIGGLAGALQVLAYEFRFYQGFSPGYGFDALGVALLAGSNPLGVLPSAFLFGVLSKGGTVLSIEGIPKGITTVVLGALILVAAAIRYRRLEPVE